MYNFKNFYTVLPKLILNFIFSEQFWRVEEWDQQV